MGHIQEVLFFIHALISIHKKGKGVAKVVKSHGTCHPDTTVDLLPSIHDSSVDEVLLTSIPEDSSESWKQTRIEELLRENQSLRKELDQKKLVEKELNQVNRLYRMMLETSKDVISTMTLDLKYTYVSPSVKNALGYSPEEMLQMNALEIMTPESRDTITGSLKDWMVKGASGLDPDENSRTEVAQQYMSNGEIRWAEITGTFLRDESGRPVGILTTSRDITQRVRLESELQSSLQLLEKRVMERTAELEAINEMLLLEIHQRKKAERELMNSERRCEAIFQAAHDCIFMKDKDLKYTHVNPAMLELTGKPISEIVGKRFDDVLYALDKGIGIERLDLKALNGQTVESDYTLLIGDRQIVLNCIRVPIRDEAGEVTGLCGIARDITERKAQTVKKITFPTRSASPAYQKTLREVELVAGTASTVLFLGESGSGKDYLAKYLHEKSRRAGSPFFAVNCAALPPSLAESELFGHEAGSFTGSRMRKRGLLELAEAGTLLLNEIGELSVTLQAKLLTFMDTHSFTRVGGEKLINIDARILAATNKNLLIEVERGNFRNDLFFRINVFTVLVPPLRERIEDLPQLCADISAGLAKKLGLNESPFIDPKAMKILQGYDWPGNIRELKNVLERALILSGKGNVEEQHLIEIKKLLNLSNPGRHKLKKDKSNNCSIREATCDLQKSLIKETLINNGGNVTRAAESLGMTRDALKHLMKKLGLKRRNVIDHLL
jgi:PAS domain S-box-containing protein